MPKVNVGLASATGGIGRISFESENVYATGGPDFPKLVFNLELRLCPLRNYFHAPQNQQIHPLTWLSLSGRLYSPEQREVAEFRQDLNLFVDANGDLETQSHLGIPLDLLAVERIERARDGNLRGALQFEGLFAVHLPGSQGILRFETARIEMIAFTIPKSKWVEQLLSQLGYGQLELIEIRISDGKHPGSIPKAVEQIRQARDHLAAADWEKAVAHCRNTLETILDAKSLQLSPASKFGQKVDTFITDHLPVLDREKAEFLAKQMNALWTLCSKQAHPNVPDYFTRADADFIVRNTTIVLEYVSRLLT